MHRLGRVMVATAMACAVLAGCGGSGDGEAAPDDTVAEYVPPEGSTVEEWRAQMATICDGFEARLAPLAGRLETNDPEEALALIGELLPLMDGFVVDLAAVPPPAGRLRNLEQLQQDIDEYRGAVEQGRAAASARDVNDVYAMIRELNRQGVVLSARLADLGVDACAE